MRIEAQGSNVVIIMNPEDAEALQEGDLATLTLCTDSTNFRLDDELREAIIAAVLYSTDGIYR